MRISTSLAIQVAASALLVSSLSVPTTNGYLSLSETRARAIAKSQSPFSLPHSTPDTTIEEIEPSSLSLIIRSLRDFMHTLGVVTEKRPALLCYCGSGVVCCDYPEGAACGYGICSI